MTTDPSALIATGLEHEERMTETPWTASNAPAVYKTVPFEANVSRWYRITSDGVALNDALGIAWLRNNGRAILTGWARALDEAKRLTADRDHWREARRVAIEGGEVLKAEVERLTASNGILEFQRDAFHDESCRLRTELGECRLVIEQQDRDLERMRDGLTKLRDNVNHDCECRSWALEIDDILEKISKT